MSTPADEHVTAAEPERAEQLALEAGSARPQDTPAADIADAELAEPTRDAEADGTARSAADHDDPADDDDVADEYPDAPAARPHARSAAPARIVRAGTQTLDRPADGGSAAADSEDHGSDEQDRGPEGEGGRSDQEYRTDGAGSGPAGEGYGPDGDAYGPDGEGHGPDGEDYDPAGEGHGPDAEDYGPDGEGYRAEGEGYDPETESYGPDGASHGAEGEDAEYAESEHADYPEAGSGRPGDPDFVPTRRGRGGYDPEADAIARAARYTFRQRAVLGLVLAALTSGALGVAVDPLAWWGCGLSIVVLVTYLAYLRKQVRMEEDIRRRRSARLGRGHGPADAGVHHRAEEHARRVMDRDTARSLRRRSTLLETDDEDPAFHHLDPFDPAAARALRRATASEMRRAAGE